MSKPMSFNDILLDYRKFGCDGDHRFVYYMNNSYFGLCSGSTTIPGPADSVASLVFKNLNTEDLEQRNFYVYKRSDNSIIKISGTNVLKNPNIFEVLPDANEPVFTRIPYGIYKNMKNAQNTVNTGVTSLRSGLVQGFSMAKNMWNSKSPTTGGRKRRTRTKRPKSNRRKKTKSGKRKYRRSNKRVKN